MKYYVEGHIVHYFSTVVEAETAADAEEYVHELAESDEIEGPMDVEIEIDSVSDASVVLD